MECTCTTVNAVCRQAQKLDYTRAQTLFVSEHATKLLLLQKEPHHPPPYPQGGIDLHVCMYIYIYTFLSVKLIHAYRYIHTCASSAAQGGGGSFKDRSTIGEVSCCDAWMAERIHWWTDRWLELCLLEWLQWSAHPQLLHVVWCGVVVVVVIVVAVAVLVVVVVVKW